MAYNQAIEELKKVKADVKLAEDNENKKRQEVDKEVKEIEKINNGSKKFEADLSKAVSI